MCQSDHTHSQDGSGTWALNMLVGEGLWYPFAEKGQFVVIVTLCARRPPLTPCGRIQTPKGGRREQWPPAKKATSLVFEEDINHSLSCDTGFFGYDLRPLGESFWTRS